MEVLLTGASGFLGLALRQTLVDCSVVTLGRGADSNIICDLSAQVPSLPIVDLVIHMAGKAHVVPKTDEERMDFFNVNVKGTEHLLKGLKQAGTLPKSFVFISSVAVYGVEVGEFIKEDHPLNAVEPYGKSKIMAEEIVQKWCSENKVICSILRLPLLAGSHPPGNLGAMIKGIRKGYYFNIKGSEAKKSVVLTKDVAQVIPKLATIGGIYNLTDGYHPTFSELSSMISKKLGKSEPLEMPLWLAKLIATIGDVLGPKFPLNSNKLHKITSNLTFDDAKARANFDWSPKLVLNEFNID